MTQAPGTYDHRTIEAKWQQYWLSRKTFKTTAEGAKPKYYILDMFPYPSGDGLHVGHPEGYTATDIMARFKRMRGFNVLHPMGWDAFGLPAEQHAVRTGTHPRATTVKNITRFRQQIQSLGLSYDWDREIDTTDEGYCKWTQWIFLKLFERGLAYESFAPVNWCQELGTVLANEEVIDGKSEVGGFPVTKRPMRQWVLKITAYAERLLQDLDELDWPDAIKEQQRNWIGKSVGATVTFDVDGQQGLSFKVFTTRPDTLFGATFVVLSPEHPLVAKIVAPQLQTKVEAYIQSAQRKSDRDRLATTDKSGEFTGASAINPVNGEAIPIYIADYVLMSYGHGAIMAVPAHDDRDHAFARKFNLPIRRVLTGGLGDIEAEAHCGDGTLVNSGFLNGKDKAEAIQAMTDWLVREGRGEAQVTYKLRDWLFSRQRYWGEPIPIAHDMDGRPLPIPEKDLPVRLPPLEDYKPTGGGEPPLARAPESWLNVELQGKPCRRETNVMPQWAGSCWYYLRFIDPRNPAKAWDEKLERQFMPVDLYVGGAEHAVLHLLYARFWHKVLYDMDLVSTKEPFKKLVNQGMILGENGEKMSKSRGNVVNPDDVVGEWGADSFRLYEMFMGPLEATKPWQTNGIVGCNRFVKRAYRLFVGEDGALSTGVSGTTSETFRRLLHKTIKKVTDDTEGLRFNTAIAAMMEFVNAAYREESMGREAAQSFVLLLAPYAPHLAEDLWERLGHRETLAYHPWPSYDATLVADDTLTVTVQVNGKLRGIIQVSPVADKVLVLSQAKELEGVARYLDGKNLLKEIYVPGKIVNFVVS